MRYLAYFRPQKELADLILKQSYLVLPGPGLHASLCRFNMDEEQEAGLLNGLAKVQFQGFEIETLRFDDFDEGSLVLRLSLPDELFRLHQGVVSVVEREADESFEETVQRYCLERYNPHLTISQSSSGFDRSSSLLIGRKSRVSQYHLAKKKDGVWREIASFSAVP